MATCPSTRPVTTDTVEPRGRTVASLFDLHADGLYRLAVAMLREPDSAQDVVQDTFLRLIAHVDAGGPLPNARGWLYTVAAHACRDRQGRLARWLPWIAERDTRRAPESADRRDEMQTALDAIRALAPRDRLLVALRAQGLSYREIADAAGIRTVSVGRLLARALDRLQEELDHLRE
jgi:RNA polymerase sigma-70 factor, ECF subfamily